MRSRPWIVVLAAGVLVGGCGADPTLSAGSAEDLHGQVAAVRAAVDDGDRDAALERLDRLEADARDLEDDGSLAAADADALRRGIGRARRRVRAELRARGPDATEAPTEEPTEEPTPEPTATPAPSEPEEDEGAPPAGKPGKGNGEAKGKAKKGGG